MSAPIRAAGRAVKRLALPKAALDVDPALLATGTVLAFDGALAKTGWAVVNREPGAAPAVLASGLLRTASPLTSHEQTFARTDLLTVALADVFMVWESDADEIVCERPAVTGMRTESSLMAAYAVHRLTGGRFRLVSRQHAVRVFCGPTVRIPGQTRSRANADGKARSRAAVWAWLGITGAAPFGQDVCDAVLVGLTRLYDKAQEDL